MDSTAAPRRPRISWPPAIACATLLLAFMAVAGWFSMAIPLGEGPDEPGHAEYVFFVARTGRLPDQRLNDVPGEGHQPPLAYWLMRPAALAAPRPLRQVHLTANPRWLWTGGDETAAFSRRSVDFFPYRDDARAWHLMRLFSIGCGALTVLLAYGSGRRLGLGWQPALLCAALLAFWPQFLFHSALVSNDPPLWTLAALLFWLLLDPRLPAAPPRWLIPAIGLVFGAALLTKQSALAFGPLIALGLWRARRRWLALGTAFGAAALAAGWWYGRNLALYGDLFGLTAYHGAFESPPFKPWLGAHWAAAGRALGSSMVARLGWMNLSPPGWVYGFALALVVLSVQGWLIGFPGIRWRRAFPLAAAPGYPLVGGADRLRLALALPALALAWTVLFALIGGQVAWQGRFVLPAGPA
ncbi:MAG TPA: phospholipid carrier-dependent glycosyltransferase, partial [Herpetosiphonaceae bacterium]